METLTALAGLIEERLEALPMVLENVEEIYNLESALNFAEILMSEEAQMSQQVAPRDVIPPSRDRNFRRVD